MSLNDSRKPSVVLRVLDANLNRLKEGIRVVEDICRYTYNRKDIVYKFKNIRHRARLTCVDKIIQARDILGDVARDSTRSEVLRQDIDALLHANFCRICESARVLEECLKLEECRQYGESQTFKLIRYDIYELQRMVFEVRNAP